VYIVCLLSPSPRGYEISIRKPFQHIQGAVSEINNNEWLEPNNLPDLLGETVLYDPQYFIVGG